MNQFSQPTSPVCNSVKAAPSPRAYPAVMRGSLGFATVSVAAFSVWAFAGRWCYAHIGEAGLYAVIAMVFLGLSGLLLHPLVRGPGSLLRFYRIFVPAFLAYAVVWCGAWFAWHFGTGEWLGSLFGSVVFAALVGRAFGNFRRFIQVSAVLFVTHSAGYFLGGKWMDWLSGPAGAELLAGFSKTQISALAKLGWGLLYGLGLGAGLGYAFFTFQNRPHLANTAPSTSTQNTPE